MTEPVRQHVAAKRYLCAVDPGYLAGLSPASVCTLRLQGGPFDSAETADFASRPHARDAVAVRRWDDAAKDPPAAVRSFVDLAPVITRVLTGLPGDRRAR